MSDSYPNPDLDLSLLNEIADGSDEFIIETIDMFLQQTPEILTLIAEGLEAKDWAATASAAHKLKPTLGLFGMLNTQALIQYIESNCKAGGENPGEITAKFKEAKANIEANTSMLLNIKTEAAARI